MNLLDMPSDYKSQFSITRYPKTNNRSLQGWSKADEFLISTIKKNNLSDKSITIYNDTFGYLSCHLISDKIKIKIESASQKKSIIKNIEKNELDIDDKQFIDLTYQTNDKPDVIVIKVPKSTDLFEQYLKQISLNMTDDTIVICSFMTKYFSKGMIEIAQKYFENVTQSKAWKKSRLITLSNIRSLEVSPLIHEIDSEFGLFKQYYGVFSANKIDYATQFLIQNIELPEITEYVLDLASGNGVLAKQVQDKLPEAKIHLVDDSLLAIESSKLNITGENIYYHFENDLYSFDDNYFDYIISNPPFHVEHEIDVSLPLGLFEQTVRCLVDDGVFQLVFNNHLNYATHLSKLFKDVIETAKNEKFTILTCKFPIK